MAKREIITLEGLKSEMDEAHARIENHLRQAGLLEAGEEFLSNFPFEGGSTYTDTTAAEAKKRLEERGSYESVRIVDAFDVNGNPLPYARAVIVRPKELQS